jgi:hypothetical protein
MKTLTIRGIDKHLSESITKLAKKSNISINKWALNQIKKASGMDKEDIFKTYHDLDHLAGVWSEKEYKEFQKNTRQFEKIDEEIWK